MRIDGNVLNRPNRSPHVIASPMVHGMSFLEEIDDEPKISKNGFHDLGGW